MGRAGGRRGTFSIFRHRFPAAYLAVFVLGVPLALLANAIYPGIPVFKGQALAVMTSLTCAVLGILLWSQYRPPGWNFTMESAYLICMIVAWLSLMWRLSIGGQGFNYTSFLVPLLLLLLLAKPLSSADVETAGVTLAWATITCVILYEVHSLARGAPGPDLEIALRLFSFGEDSTADGRWMGPFSNPNYAGPAGAYLALFGWSLRGPQKWLIAGSGFAMVLASGSRSALLGVLLGSSVYVVFGNWSTRRLASKIARLVVVAFGLGLLAAIAVTFDPTLNGRTAIWPKYFEFWSTSPWTGVGTHEIRGLIDSQVLGPWYVHAHNELLDLLGRNGLAGAVPVLLALSIALLTTARGAVRGSPMGLSVVSLFVTIGLVEVHGAWVYWSLPTVWLLLAVLAQTRSRVEANSPDRQDSNFYG